MDTKDEAFQDPFSPEKAWLTFQENMDKARRLREEIRQDLEAGGKTDRELILKATEALGMLTDNTVIARVVRRALEERDAK